MMYLSRHWKAIESSDLVGHDHKLTVTGEVQTLKTNETPHLSLAHPQGFVKEELILDLKVEKHDEFGGDVVHFVAVEFQHEITAGEYHSVLIRGETESVVVKVERVLSVV